MTITIISIYLAIAFVLAGILHGYDADQLRNDRLGVVGCTLCGLFWPFMICMWFGLFIYKKLLK